MQQEDKRPQIQSSTFYCSQIIQQIHLQNLPIIVHTTLSFYNFFEATNMAKEEHLGQYIHIYQFLANIHV